MLGIPNAFSRCGMVAGLALILVFAGLSSLGLYMLSAACDIIGRPASFRTVAEKAMPGSGMLLSAAIAIKCFGVGTSYLIVVGDAMPQALLAFGIQAESGWLDRRLWSFLAALVVSPLCFLRSVHSLRHFSLVALVCILFVVVLIVTFAVNPPLAPVLDPCPRTGAPSAHAAHEDDEASYHATNTSLVDAASASLLDDASACRGPVVSFGGGVSTLTALPTFIFAYTCHQVGDLPRSHALACLGMPSLVPSLTLISACTSWHQNIVGITNELRGASPSGRRTSGNEVRVIGYAMAIAMSIYTAVAVGGYATFGAYVHSDVLTSYPTSPLLAVARVAVAIVVTLSYPLQSHPSRACVLAIAEALDARRARTAAAATAGGSAVAPLPTSARRDRRLFLLVTTAFLVLSTVIALLVSDLSLILSIVGATGSTTVSYLLPGLCYWRLCADPRARLRRAALGLLVFGVAVMILSLSLIVIRHLPHSAGSE